MINVRLRAARMPRPGSIPAGRLIAACALLLVIAAPAAADVGPSVRLRLQVPDDRLPTVGEVFAFDLELTSGIGAIVDAPRLATSRLPNGQWAWDQLSFPLPERFELAPMQPASFPVQLACNDPFAPITIRMQVDGRTVTQDFHLLPQAVNSTDGGDETVMELDSDKGGPLGVDTSFERPEPAPVTRKNVRDRRAEFADPSKGRNIRVHGRFVYHRNSHNQNNEFIGDGLTMGADGVTVFVYDEDWDWDDLLASAVLGPDGTFDITFYYDQAEAPDIYLEFNAANSKVDLVYPSIWNVTYTWRTPVRDDFTGSVINYGTRKPASQAHYAGLHILSTLTKSWRWLNANGFGGIDNVLVSWPDSDWPHYKSVWETIYIPRSHQWTEATLAHEYGHHWSHEYSVLPDSEYCNVGDRLDAPGEDCRHGSWCMENAGVALQEGFANWVSAMVTRGFPSLYGAEALMIRDYETIERCTWDGLNEWDPAWKTHGFFSAFLQDLVDGQNEQDPNRLDWGADVLTWPVSRVLQVQAAQDPVTPLGLIWALRLTYPLESEGIWMAAANNRFEQVDTTPPTTPAGLTSTSHLTVGDSPDATVDLVWNAASDDFSGVRAYRVRWNLGSALAPNWNSAIATTTAISTPTLAPGVWWFTVDAVDRAGNLSGGHATFGPVTIRQPIPADVRAHSGNTWPYAIVPRNTNDATSISAPLPATLFGNSNSYMNLRVQNTGEVATSPTLRLNFYEDGLLNWWSSIVTLSGLGERSYLNVGPFPMRGGRHTIGMWADAFEQMPETNEADNIWSRQFVWSPLTLNNIFLERQRPPHAWGGFDWDIFSSPNSDGFRFSMNTDPYVGAVMLPGNLTADYDVASSTASTGPNNGFSLVTRKVQSLRPAGCLDAVFANNEQTAETTVDVGVLNYANHHGTFKIRRLQSQWLGNGGVNVFLNADAPMQLRHLFLPVNAGTNHGTVTLQADPAAGPLHIMVIPNQVVHASLTSLPTAATDESGFARLDYTYTAQTQGLVVWQDPRDVPAGASGSVTAWLWSGPTPADLVPYQTAGWFGPVVPTQGAPGSSLSAVPPSTLAGNAPSTYFNAMLRNQSPGVATGFLSTVYLDGLPRAVDEATGLNANTTRSRNFPEAQTVRGGRHTLSLHIDVEDWVVEGDEANNLAGLQYVWSPLLLAPGAVLERPAPPDPLGGYVAAAAWAAEPLWFNCDGLRLAATPPAGGGGWWQAVAAAPTAGDRDIDLRLHEAVDHVLAGFRDPLAASVWSAGASDYVLVNQRATTPRAFDVGVVGLAGVSPAGDYRAQAVGSTFLDGEPDGDYGPFALGGDQLLALHEVRLAAGLMRIDLLSQDGNVAWGMTLHRAQLPFQSKSYAPGIVGQAWSAPAGEDATMTVEIQQDGFYCLAVWKVGAADLGQSGTYKLAFGAGATGAPDAGSSAALPTVTALREVWPNPFNPSTRIAFDLAVAGRVQLEVYDVRGKLVRRLASESLPAGRHQRTWDGRSDAGDGVASGNYFARLVAGGKTSTRKMLLVK